MKEFVAAGNDEKKAIFSKIEEEVEKLKDSSSRYKHALLYESQVHFHAYYISCLEKAYIIAITVDLYVAVQTLALAS